MKQTTYTIEEILKQLEKISKTKDGIITYADINKFVKEDDDNYDDIIKELSNMDIPILKNDKKDESEFVDDDDDIDSILLDDEDDEENFTMTFQSLESTLRTDDPVRMYLREIGNIPLLTNDEELAVAKRIQSGKEAQERIDEIDLANPENDQEIDKLEEIIEDGNTAKEILVESNLRLVVSIAKKHVNKGLQFLDLIQEGNMGLMKATEKFDCSKGFKFSTYATWWIRQAITRAIADQGRIVRIPVHMVEQINKVVRFTRKFTQENRREPSLDEISEALDITIEKIKTIKKISQDPVSLESPVGEEEDSTLGDFIPDNSSLDPDEYTNKEMLKLELDKVLSTLTDREERVIRMRYGLDDGRTHTLEEVGEVFGVTRERIRQIEFKAIRKIKQPTKSKKLLEYLND